MPPKFPSPIYSPDSAAVFACAMSLWESCERGKREEWVELSRCYHGMDGFMREVMRVANQFEEWSCLHVDFDAFGEPWPYFLGDHFGDGCLAVVSSNDLAAFGEADCLRIALHLKIPVIRRQ